MNLDLSFKKIINPPKEFLVIDDILKNERYMRLLYDKIFSEMIVFLEKEYKGKMQECGLKGNKGKIIVKTEYEFILEIEFSKDNVEIFINGNSIGNSTIFGANIDKNNLIVSNIKVDLVSFKKEIKNNIN